MSSLNYNALPGDAAKEAPLDGKGGGGFNKIIIGALVVFSVIIATNT